MKLKEVRIKLYRNFVDSSLVPIDDNVTCLIGQNESGKTAFLEALYSLKPVYSSLGRADIIMDYPRWRKVRDEKKKALEEVSPIEAIFSLGEEDLEEIHDIVKVKLPKDSELFVERTYGGEHRLRLSISEDKLVQEIVASELSENEKSKTMLDLKSLDDLLVSIKSKIVSEDKRTREGKELSNIVSLINQAKKILSGNLSEDQIESLVDLIPTFFYFSEYSPLEGRIDLTTLLDKQEEDLEDHEQTALSLLKLVSVEGPEFMDTKFEIRIAELESAANELSRQIFEYWTQNKDLKVDFHTDSQTISTTEGKKVVHRYLDIRLNDLRHQMTTNFQTRSRGFQWFFSFIVAFSEYMDDTDVIILLDEPGLGLHARAQGDLLNFIEDKLSSQTQVIYTSHSPFAVNPKHLERVRLVEDLSSRENPDVGVKISTDVLSVKKDTLFPLQATLGYDLAQNLFVGGYNLIVEGPSDYIFLTILSEYLEAKGKDFLDPNFTIIPVGGADKIPTFVALLGAHLNISVLIDVKVTQNQRLQDLIDKGLLVTERLVSIGQIIKIAGSSIEDLFEPDEYINLYNEAFGKKVKITDLKGNDSIIRRLERHIGNEFNHIPPSILLLNNRDAYLNDLSGDTIKRFQKLFKLLNKTL